MKMQTRSKTSCCIDRRAVEKGSRSPVANQAGIEKSVTSVGTSNTLDEDNTARMNPVVVLTDILKEKNQSHRGLSAQPSCTGNNKKETRKKWTREDYKDVMYAFYFALEKPSQGSTTKRTYVIWKNKQKDNERDYIDANGLANVRRDIMRNHRLTQAEIAHIKVRVREEIELSNGNDKESETRDKDTENTVTVCTDRDTIEQVHAVQEATNRSTEEQNEQQNESTENQNKQQDDNRKSNKRGADTNIQLNEDEIEKFRLLILNELSKVQHTNMTDREPLRKIRINKKVKMNTRLVNAALEIITEQEDFEATHLNELIYAASKVITEQSEEKKVTKPRKRRKPKWKERIDAEIQRLRGELSIISEVERGVDVKGVAFRRLKYKYKLTHSNLKTVKENIKQKMQLKAQRKRRFEKRTNFYRQNLIFKTDPKKFYREIGKKPIKIEEVPPIEEVEKFWKAIWSEGKSYNKDAPWIENIVQENEKIKVQEWKEISLEEITNNIQKAHNWKSPGIDKVPNFWLKSLVAVHNKLALSFSKIINHPDTAPNWLTDGITYLLPKNHETKNPKNYRPITCLSTTYKLLTSILTERIYGFMDQHKFLPQEQKGSRKGSYGCKDQLLINRMIMENSKNRQRNLSMAWIDYRKAFDSVPHDWILKSLELYKLSPVLINFLKTSMSLWGTTVFLNSTKETIKSDRIDINCGIFQGDSLSPLLFCLALIPLTSELNQTSYGYKIGESKINHLFYMDDLKLYAKDDKELEGLLHTVKSFSDDIGMDFGLDKCAKATFIKGKLKRTTSVVIDTETVIKDLEQEELYKYLGINEGNGIQHSKMKEIIRNEFYRRVKAILKTELNAQNKIEAINTLAIPVVTYSFNIINWSITALQRLDIRVRKLLTANRMLHPKADIDRLYVPRKEGGRGMIQLELSLKIATIGMQQYLEKTSDWMLKLVRDHESKKKTNSISKQSKKYEKELNVKKQSNEELPCTIQAKQVKVKAKAEGIKQIKSSWENKPFHG